MTNPFKAFIPTVALIAALALGPVAPEAGNVLFLAGGLIGLALSWSDIARETARPIIWMPLLGLVLIGIAYFVSSGPSGLSGLLYFAPLLAIAPLANLLGNANRSDFAFFAGALAFCGASAAGIMAISEVTTTGIERAGGAIANPIHFADVALLTGFIALAGMAAIPSLWRYVFLAGPVMASIAVVLSGTRGAVVALVAMLVAAALIAAWVRLIPRRFVLIAAVGFAVASAIALALGAGQIFVIQRIVADITSALDGSLLGDSSSNIRVQMYLGGLRAFFTAPIFGHGPLAFTAVANELADVPFGTWDHLHNDLVDMSASAGLLGIAAYLLIILAPVVETWRSGSPRWIVVLTVTLVTGFFVMGLTNAMFGILSLTTTFAAIAIIAGALAAQSEPRSVLADNLRAQMSNRGGPPA